jgi:hypothetical protein
VPALAAALAVGLAVLASCGDSTGLATDGAPAAASSTPAAQWPDGVVTYEDLSNSHVEGEVDYPTAPPAGGEHSSAWQNCGVYDEPIADESAVHSLEHGAVWITYRPDLPFDEVQRLEDLVGTSGYVLLSPYQGQDPAVALTGWGVQLMLDDVGDSRVDRFLAEYVNGPQTPEPGAPCSGGIGKPDQRRTT